MSSCNSGNSVNTGYSSGIGPYSYLGWGASSSCTPCNDNGCDQYFELDYGTTRWICKDWTNELEQIKACKIMHSEWWLEQNSSSPPELINNTFDNFNSSVLIQGGLIGTEYKLWNMIYTENGQTLKISVCVKIVGEITVIPVYQNGQQIGIANYPSSNMVNVNNNVTSTIVENSTFKEGTYSNSNFCPEPICNLKINLLCGEAVLVYTDNMGQTQTIPVCTSGVTINNDGEALTNFYVIVQPNSEIGYEVTKCP